MIKNNYTAKLGFIYIYLFYCAYTIMPVFSFLFTVYIQIAIVLFILFHIFSGRNTRSLIRFSLPFSLIFIFELITNIKVANDVADFIGVLYDSLLFVLPIFLIYYLLINNYRNAILKFITISSVLFIITIITSIYGLLSDVNAARIMSAGNVAESVIMNYNKQNIGGFAIAYMIPVVLPMLFAYYSKKKISLFVFVPVLGSLTYYIYLAQFSIALILFVLSFTSIFIAYKYSSKRFMLIILTIFLISSQIKPILTEVLYFAAEYNESQAVSVRLKSMGDITSGVGTKALEYTERIDRYSKSIDAFKSSPIIGVFYTSKKPGGHSFLLDYLALFGILGIIGLVIFYRQVYNFLYRPFKNESYYGYMIWSLFSSLILGFLNPTASIFIICFIVPLMAYSLQDKKYVIKRRKGLLV